VDFEWDDAKAKGNQRKHGVGFGEARTVFRDPLAWIFDDLWHSMDERREIIIGHSRQGRLLLVCFTERRQGTVRIISSREATAKERRDYEKQRHH
jgi:uncharacterized DUF497 family protein